KAAERIGEILARGDHAAANRREALGAQLVAVGERAIEPGSQQVEIVGGAGGRHAHRARIGLAHAERIALVDAEVFDAQIRIRAVAAGACDARAERVGVAIARLIGEPRVAAGLIWAARAAGEAGAALGYPVGVAGVAAHHAAAADAAEVGRALVVRGAG